MKKKIIVLLLLAATLLSGCNHEPGFVKAPWADIKDVTKEAFYFDTIIDYHFYGDEADSIVAYAEERSQYYDSLFSIGNTDSDISKINNAAGDSVVVSSETIELLNYAIEIASQTDGIVDPTIGTISSLWDFTGENPKLPDESELLNGVSHIDYRNIVAEGNTVTLNDPEAQIDVGFIAKGYIADRLYEEINNKFDDVNGIINLGGNVMLFGTNPIGDCFYDVGIKDPQPHATGYKVARILSLPGGYSVATAGSYERCFDLDGVHYFHILDIKTGQPVRTVLTSVSVYGPSSTFCDGLSTALFIMGADKGAKFLKENYPGYEAVFITNMRTVIETTDTADQ